MSAEKITIVLSAKPPAASAASTAPTVASVWATKSPKPLALEVPTNCCVGTIGVWGDVNGK